MARLSRSVSLPLLFLCVLALSTPHAVASDRAGAAAVHVRSDFNGDGFADMAVGVPRENVGTTDNAGAVNVIYGSAAGLAAAGNQFWTQASAGVPTAPEDQGSFGVSVASGDFNGDGFADLAVGAAGQEVSGFDGAGIVIVLYGTAQGLTSNGAQVFDQDSEFMQGTAEDNDQFGLTLAAGNFGRSSQDDLAIGVPGQDVGTALNAGVIQVVYGSITGLSQNGNQLWSQDTTGVAGDGAETDDSLGGTFGETSGMVAANFGKDGHADLAASAIGDDVGAVHRAGAVLVLYGSSGGLKAAGSQFWTQDVSGVADQAEEEDQFGTALAAGNFGMSSQADLAIAAAGDDVGTDVDCGVVNVLYGSSGGLTTAGNQLFSQDTTGVAEQCDTKAGITAGDTFGYSLAAANFGKTSQADLAVGAPGEDLGTEVDAGVAQVLYGATGGLSTTGNQLWSQDSTGVKDVSEGSTSATDVPDFFSFSMLGADFGKSGEADLAVGAVGEDLVGNTLADAGAVNVLYGGASGLSSAGNQLWTQDSSGIKDEAEEGDLFGFGFASGPGSAGSARRR